MIGRICCSLALLAVVAAAAADRFNPKVAALDPFPREVARGRTLTIKGFVKGGYKAPELIIIAPNGKTFLNKDNKVGEFHFTYKVRFEEGPGPYRMELIARKATAIKSAARFTVHYGKRKPAQEKETPLPRGKRTPRELHPRLVEKRFLERLNAFRREIKIPEVGWNEAVAARAREHAERMAKAKRRQHRFGNVGVREMLAQDGAGPGGMSGPDDPWDRLDGVRPFKRPAMQPPGPRVRNHIVIFVLASSSQEGMFLRHFVREAAFRICALDPFCLEVGVGAARTPPKPVKTTRKTKRTTTRRPGQLVYYCICFVQINDKTIAAGQDRGYRKILKKAAKRDPAYLRQLGVWGRGGKAWTLLERASGDKSRDIQAAAYDGMLLLDESRTRKAIDKIAQLKEDALGRRQYAVAAELFAPFRGVQYDGAFARAANRVADDADRTARTELAQTKQLAEPERTNKLRDLERRTGGLPVNAEIRKLLGEG